MSENICSIGAGFVLLGSIASAVVCIKVTTIDYLAAISNCTIPNSSSSSY